LYENSPNLVTLCDTTWATKLSLAAQWSSYALEEQKIRVRIPPGWRFSGKTALLMYELTSSALFGLQ
jgi:hypothetical protein